MLITEMKYIDFKNKFKDFPLISSSQLNNLTSSPQVLKNQLTTWQKKGLIIKLKKGLYILNKDDRKVSPSRIFLANQIYSPSYVSCEYALAFYNLIPERVFEITSVTSRKTTYFENELGIFKYHNIKLSGFFGYEQQVDENDLNILIASPEKAVLDFFYFNLRRLKGELPEVFEQSFRFQNVSKLGKRNLIKFAKEFNSIPLRKATESFIGFIDGAK